MKKLGSAVLFGIAVIVLTVAILSIYEKEKEETKEEIQFIEENEFNTQMITL